MTNPVIGWLDSKDFAVQVIVIDAVFFPTGILLGYLSHPYLGVEPMTGAAFGAIVGSVPIALWVLRHRKKKA